MDGASRRGRCAGSPRSAAVPPRTAGQVLDGVAEQPCLGDGGVEKVCLVNVLNLYQVEPEMALLDHHGGHRLPEGPRRDFRRS